MERKCSVGAIFIGRIANYRESVFVNIIWIITEELAIEYYGMSDQVYYDVYVSSATRFREFEFDGYTYKYIHAKTQDGVENVQFSGGVRVTDMEKTLVDSVKDMDRILGLEEVTAFIQSIRKLNEDKLCRYMAEYGSQFLYQKMGYLLENYASVSGVTKELYQVCLEQTGKSKRYLSKDVFEGTYNAKTKGLKAALKFAKEHDMCMTEAWIQGANNM